MTRTATYAKRVEIYDTTLRDGSQLEGISLTVEDKLRIAEQLDWLGVHYIEAGWPGANPKDDELFRRAPTRAEARRRRTLVAFGSTRRVKGKVDSDDTLRHLVEANVGTVCIVGKSWDYHVLEALGTTLDEGVAMVADSVEFLRGAGMDVLFDAEHFFDGYKRNPEFALRVLEAAATKGASPRRAVRHQRRRAAARGRADRRARSSTYFGGDVQRRGAPARRRAAPAWPTRSPACSAARRRCRERSTATASAPATATSPTIIPNLTLKMGIETIPRRPHGAAHAGRAPRRRAREHAAQPAGRVRRVTPRSRTRPGCT